MKKYTHNLKVALLASSPFLIGSNLSAIPESYGTATHSTQTWQELAEYDDNNNLVDPFGISWSVDNGSTWGREDLRVGQTVKFQFNMHKRNVGTHYADFLKVWLDWDKSGIFDADESIFFAQEELPDDIGSYIPPAFGEANFKYFSDDFVIDEAFAGDLWLRGRVVCSESLVVSDGGSWNDQWSPEYLDKYDEIFKPTGHLHQGESEDWNIFVSVPDASSTFALLASALVAVTLIHRKFRS